jgi:hypothetical protein
MATLLDASTFPDPAEAMAFIANVLEVSTEYSIIGKDLEGKILPHVVRPDALAAAGCPGRA